MRALLTLTLLVTSGMALAQRADFAALDKDGDGYLNRIEAAADPEIARRFTQFDADRDRRLSAAEHGAAREDSERRQQSDAALTERVRAALIAERGIPSKAISVETYDGRVQLSGFVPLADMASRAGRITAAVAGVRTVHNNIGVK